jgi:predicted amidohydrolase
MKKLNAASVQFQHRPGDKKYNFDQIQSFVESAFKQKTDLIVFPEMCITGYWHIRHLSKVEIENLAEPIHIGPSTRRLLSLASKYKMTIGAGLIEQSDDGALYNSYVVAMPDGKVNYHRKLHCFISEHMSSGDTFTVFDIPQGAKVGILICYDNNIIENVRITKLMGAEILLAPHQTGGCNSPSPRCMGRIDPLLWEDRKNNPEAIEAELRGAKGRDWLMHWLPARAHDNGLFLIYSNGIGLDDDEVRTGNAMILDPYGDILVETCKADNDMVTTTLDPKVLHMCTGERWLTSRRPELYTPLTRATGREKDTRTVRFTYDNESDKNS